MGEVNDAIGVTERTAIGNAHANAPPGIETRHLDPGAKRQRPVRSRHLTRVEPFAARCTVSGKPRAVPRGIPHLNFRRHRCRDRGRRSCFGRRLWRDLLRRRARLHGEGNDDRQDSTQRRHDAATVRRRAANAPPPIALSHVNAPRPSSFPIPHPRRAAPPISSHFASARGFPRRLVALHLRRLRTPARRAR